MRPYFLFIALSVLSLLGCGRPAPGPATAKPAPKPAATVGPAPKPATGVPVAPRKARPPDLSRAQAQKEVEALLTRLLREVQKPFDLGKLLVEALPSLREAVEAKDLPPKATLHLIPVRGKSFTAALLHVVYPKADVCDTAGLNSFLMVAVVRDDASGQSEARLTNLPEEDATLLFKGKNVKIGFIEGAQDPALFTVYYEYTNSEDECVDRMRTSEGDYLAVFTIFEESLTLLTLVKELGSEFAPGNEVKISSNVRWFTGGAADILAVTVFEQNAYIETGDGMDGRTATCTRISEIYSYGPDGWDFTRLPLPKGKLLHPVLKEVPDDRDADSVEACDKLQQTL